MARGEAKAALFDALASVAQALGSGRRAELVDVLAQGERSVDELAREISQSVANTSQHLRVLARAGLVRSRREGSRVFYRLASERVGDLWAAVRDVAVRHAAEVSVLAEEYLGDREEVEQLSAPELEQRLARGDVVLLDVRPEPEYRAGHIEGAQSVPLESLGAFAAALPCDLHIENSDVPSVPPATSGTAVAVTTSPASISCSRRARPRVECCSSPVARNDGHITAGPDTDAVRHLATPTQRRTAAEKSPPSAG